MERSKHTIEQKYIAIQMLKEGTHTWSEICELYQIYTYTLYQWQKKYEIDGVAGRKEADSCKAYSKDLKEAAVYKHD